MRKGQIVCELLYMMDKKLRQYDNYITTKFKPNEPSQNLE